MKNKAYRLIIAIIITLIFSYNRHLININLDMSTLQFALDIVTNISCIIYLFIISKKIETKLVVSEKILIVMLNIFLLISNSFINNGDLSYIYGSIFNVFLSIVQFIAGYFIMYKSFIYFKDLILNYKFKIKKNSKILEQLKNNPFIFSLAFVLLFWLIYIISFYPIILSPDPSFQIKQFFNVRTKYADYAILLSDNVFLTNHHPVIHTLLLGTCLQVGRFLINDNFGLFLYSIIQIIMLASTLSYTIKYLIKNNVNEKICFVILLIYSLVPMFPLYAMSGVKDTIYTCFVILYIISIDKLMNKKMDKYYNLISFIVIMIGMILFRNNGIYVILLSFPFLIFTNKDKAKKLIIIFISIIGFNYVFNNVVLPAFKITSGSTRESLSIPFQQTARYAKYYDNDIEDKDKKIIDKVLGYETLAERYNPLISDPVKNEYNKYTTSDELKSYFKVWFKYLFHHPLVYVEATLNNIYGYLSPQATNWYIYYKYDTRITEDNLVDYNYNNLINSRMILSGYAMAFPYIPIIGLLSNIGFNMWLLLIFAFYTLKNKGNKNFIVLLPLLISLLICFASPVNTYFRYAMPVAFSMPFIGSLIITRIKNKK